MTEDEVLGIFEEIRQIKIDKARLAVELEDIEKEMAAIKAVDYERPRVSGSSHSDLSDTVQRILDKQAKMVEILITMTNRLTQLLTEAYSLLDLCTNAEQRAVLSYRYIHLMDTAQIRQKMHYGRTWIYLLERQAIQAIAKKAKLKWGPIPQPKWPQYR